MDGFIGEIRMLPYTFAPEGWLACDGQLLMIQQYQALFAVIGTLYGGDGYSTFAVPDLRGTAPMGSGNGPGLTPRHVSNKAGAASVSLASSNLAAHTHAMYANNVNATAATPDSGKMIGKFMNGTTPLNLFAAASPTTPMAGQTIAPAGSVAPTPHANVQPMLPLQFCICWDGLFPIRA